MNHDEFEGGTTWSPYLLHVDVLMPGGEVLLGACRLCSKDFPNVRCGGC